MTDPVSSPLRAQLQGLNLYLVGMMGAGKSTVGQVLAQQLGYQFFDTDAVIEQATGQAIATLFAELGEPGFREMERRVLGELAAYTRLVVATGGGIVTQPENWGILRQGVVVWLDVPITELHRRLQTDTTRPLLQTGELGTRLQTLLDERRSRYAQADVQVPFLPDESVEHLATRTQNLIRAVLKTPTPPPTHDN